MRLASWNIRKCVGLDRRRDPLRVASVIAGLNADIVALQEADKRLGRRPAALPFETVRNETDMQVVDAGGLEGSLGWHGNAVLVRPEINVTGRVAMDLPGVEPRGALILDLEAKGQSLRLVAVHLGLLRSSRRAQLAALQARLAKMEARPTVILGDFNEWSRSRGIEALLGYDIHAPGRSFHAARPVAALDRIATCPEWRLEDAGVVETPTTRVASDHLPIWGNFRLR